MTAIVLLGIVAAAMLGLAGRRLTRRWSREDAGPTVPEVLGQALGLAILFLAFVLVENAQTFGRARAAASAEADTVDQMFELAGYGPEKFQQDVQATLVCYARAITHYEWIEAEKGEFAPEVGVWANRLRPSVGDLLEQNDTLFEVFVDADEERASQHQNRIIEAGGTMPGAVYALMGTTVLLSLMGFAASLPQRHSQMHILALAVLSILLAATLVLIRDLERPFTGLAKVKPVAIGLISTEMETEYGEQYGGPQLLCDSTGKAIGDEV